MTTQDRPTVPPPVVHLLSGLEVGGKERAALRLARHGMCAGERHELWLFDTPYRSPIVDLDPGLVPARFVPRRPGWDLGFVGHLVRCFRGIGAGVIHAYNDTALCYAAMACALAGSRAPKLIAAFHTWPTHGTLAARLSTRLAASRAAALTAVSDDLAARLVTAGWLPHCRTIRNGVDLDAFSPDGDDGDWHGRLGLARDRPLVVHLARFDPVKRHVDVIEAARAVHAVRPHAVFVLAGDGPLQSEMRQRAASLPFIRFVGNVAEPAPLLRAASIVVLPSLDEAAPLALLEAMACGCPTVCSNVGGMPAILDGAEGLPAGVLVPARSPADLARAVVRLLSDPWLRAQLGDRARHAAARFSFEQEWQEYSALYRSLAERLTRSSGEVRLLHQR